MPWFTSLTPTACPARDRLRLIFSLYRHRRPMLVTTTVRSWNCNPDSRHACGRVHGFSIPHRASRWRCRGKAQRFDFSMCKHEFLRASFFRSPQKAEDVTNDPPSFRFWEHGWTFSTPLPCEEYVAVSAKRSSHSGPSREDCAGTGRRPQARAFLPP
jgi:hypothetical protein